MVCMDMIKGYKVDSLVLIWIVVWKWMIDYVDVYLLGGGFDVYCGNCLCIDKMQVVQDGGQIDVVNIVEYDQLWVYYSFYFEMFGEQGWLGLILWFGIYFGGLFSMECLWVRLWKWDDMFWLLLFVGVLMQVYLIYLVGGVFVGIVFQLFVYMLVGVQIGLFIYVVCYEKILQVVNGGVWCKCVEFVFG